MKIKALIMTMILSITALVAGGCGGGGGGGGGGGSSVTTVSGLVSKGPVTGARIDVYAITGGVQGTLLGSFTPTLSDGKYSISLGSYTGPILVKATGGTYTDEATGTAKDINGLANGFRAFVANATGNVTVAITPITEMAAVRILAAATIDAATINLQNSDVGKLFGVADIIGVLPTNPAAVPPAGSTQAEIDYSLALASVSKYMQATASTLSAAIGTLGAVTPTPQAIADLVAARTAYISSVQNKSGVTGNTTATSIVLKLSTSGALAVANSIGGAQVTINLPSGVSIANISGDASASVSASGVAANSTIGANFVAAVAGPPAAPATVKVIVVKPSGFGLGEFATVNLTKTAGSIVTPAHFVLTGFKAANGILTNGSLGNALSGVENSFTVTIQ